MTMDVEMTTLKIPTQVYSDLQTLAETEQADVVEVLRRLIAQAREQPSTSGGALDRILARATDLGVEDLAEHHDYYLYGGK